MTISLPTDGFGVYEGFAPQTAGATARLDQIAAGGFKLVLNYSLLFGSISDITTYINYAASVGLKVIAALHNTVIWDTNSSPSYTDLAAEYPTLYAAAGSPTTNWGVTFGQYVVNQIKTLPGLWGYYIADEAVNADHAPLKTYADAIHSADSSHPRLIINSARTGQASASANNALFYDCCETMGDDYYPLGPNTYSKTLAQTAAAIQSYCNAHSLTSAMVLQAFSYSHDNLPQYGWPTEAQMQQYRNDAISNMTPRLILWWAYYTTINTGSPDFAPALQWSYLQDAMQGKSGIAQFPNLVRRGQRR